jgi:cystathionine beta-lyase family protein involved in aluminum resistance
MAGEAGGVVVNTIIDTAVALVTTAILTGAWAIARKRYKLLNQRDELLAEV